MFRIEAIFFDCDGTLVDSEILCSRGYLAMFARYGIQLDLAETHKRFKGIRLYDIIETISREYQRELPAPALEKIYRAEVARLFDSELREITGASALLDGIIAPMCVVSNGPVSKMQQSLGNTGMLHHFAERLYSGYDIQRWKPDPALMYHAADAMQIDVSHAILIDDSPAGAQAGIAAGMEVFYFCADPHNPPITHPAVTTFTDLAQLPGLWRQRGWQLTR